MNRSILFSVLSASALTALSAAQEVEVQFFCDDIVRIVKIPEGGKKPRPSFVVTAKPESVDVRTEESVMGKTYASAKLRVTVGSDGCVAFAKADGSPLLAEEPTVFTPRAMLEGHRGAMAPLGGGQPIQGVHRSAMDKDPDSDRFVVRHAWRLDGDEEIYGLGIIQEPSISRRGLTKKVLQENIEDFSPIIQSVKGWGILIDNPSLAEYKEENGIVSYTCSVGDAADWYFMYGGTSDGVVRQIRRLTGEVPMQPKWTLGYYVSRERYTSWRQLAEIIDEHRARGIPMDCIVQDWQYWGTNDTWNAMDFLADGFKNDPVASVKAVHDRHAKLMISFWPNFGAKTKPNRDFREHGWYFKDFTTWPRDEGMIVYDAFNPAARDLYWRYVRRLVDCGIDAWWMDFTEPESDPDSQATFDTQTFLGSYRSVCNLYPFMTVCGIYDHQRADEPDGRRRVSIMTRSCYPGLQRTGANTWSGDISSKWETLRMQIPAGLGFGLTGNPNFNTDIGGFFPWHFFGWEGGALKCPEFIELNVRWMQYALFNPIFRSHGTGVPREIWQFGDKGDAAYEAMVAAVKLRYRFLPYLYSTARWVSKDGGTMMRPLFAEYADERETWRLSDEFLFGTELLAAPVVEWKAKTRRLYLPKGAWRDFFTGEEVKGGRWIERGVALETIPLYAKAGAIVPFGPVMQYVDELGNPPVEIKVFPGADGAFTLYDDAGDGYQYEQGEFSEIPLKWDDAKKTLTIGERKGRYLGMAEARDFVVALPCGTVKHVKYEGKSLDVAF